MFIVPIYTNKINNNYININIKNIYFTNKAQLNL